MKTKTLLMGFVAVLMIVVTGCSKDNLLNPTGNCFGGNWAQEYNKELESWSVALKTYNENPTDANCTQFKNATKTYLDALNDFYDCVPTSRRAEFDQAIKEAKADLDKDSCD